MSKLNFEDSFRQKLGTWADKLKPFFVSGEMDKIYAFLKAEGAKGKKIAPLNSNTLKCFEFCNYNKLKAVIISQDPYFSLKGNTIVADGMPFSCSITKVLQPSLEIWYQGLEDSYNQGMNLNIDKRADLSYLAKEEHILLLNSALTVEVNKPLSHQSIWRPFTEYVIKEVLNNFNSGLPFIFIGKESEKFESLVLPFIHWTRSCEHMAAASYKGDKWNYNNIFKWTNEIIRQNNGESEMINWYREN